MLHKKRKSVVHPNDLKKRDSSNPPPMVLPQGLPGRNPSLSAHNVLTSYPTI